VEAISHLTKGLEVLTTFADPDERLTRELALQALLASALVATQGPASAAVEHTYAHARVLCQQIEDAPQLAPILLGLFRFYSTRAAHQTDLPPSVFGYLLSNQLVKLFQTLWCRHVICPFYSCISPYLAIK
jgi:hypothetical protein